MPASFKGRSFLAAAFAVLLTATLSVGAERTSQSNSSPEIRPAHHIAWNAPYPGRGYVWMAAWHDYALLWVSSTRCNQRELEAFARTEATTVGHFPGRWPSGIRMERHWCDGSMSTIVDIRIRYRSAEHFTRPDGSSYGGYNVSHAAPPSWCSLWGVSHPCGSHPSVVHLNRSRFFNTNWSHHYRRRLIMHETGHSLGLAHHCSGNAIMNDGTSGCNGGAWTNINGYQTPDRRAVRRVYPDWMY